MKLQIRDKNSQLISLLQYEFKDCPDVECSVGNILDLRADALVSPANSFGFMNGGIDYVYTLAFGPKLQTAVQNDIKQRLFGELFVGQAIVVTIPNPALPINWLIVAPTMRVPSRIPAINVFLAMRAAIDTALRSSIQDVLMPGMGTGSGKVPYGMAARAMRMAYQAVYNPPQFPKSLGEVQQNPLYLIK
jgi:O-acetyl-ADP-ribose deacetylase (regulator of RNase III)